jgi:hypothetical protein
LDAGTNQPEVAQPEEIYNKDEEIPF